MTAEMWDRFRQGSVIWAESFKPEIVKLILRSASRDISHNIHHTQPVDPEDLEAKLW